MEKAYLSIGEVAEKFSVSPDLLRKWEKEFPRYLHPKRTGGATRLYGRKDLQQVAVIYRLLRTEGLSVEGAKRRLQGGAMDDDESRQEVILRLQQLRQRLLGIIDELGTAPSQRPMDYIPFPAEEHEDKKDNI